MPHKKTANKNIKPKGAEMRCLIADDSAYARRNTSLFIKKLGGTVIGEASNGLEAVSQYQRLHPDVVLMDITMPQMDGIEALDRIIHEDPDAVVIMLSAIGHEKVLKQALSLGAKHFLTKPIEFSYAAEIVRSVIDTPAASERAPDED